MDAREAGSNRERDRGIGVADGCTLMAAPCEPLAMDAVGTSDGALVA
ncbi:MAG: hypothetical protein WCB79_07580 [Halobacteriota archaeon]